MNNNNNNKNTRSTGEMSQGKSSQRDPKRDQRFLLGNSDQYSNKKKAVKSAHKTQTLAPIALSSSLMIGGSSSRSANQVQNNSFNALASINTETTSSNDRFKKDDIISLNMAEAAEDPQFRNTALRKVKVREVTVQEKNSPELNRFSFPVYGINNNVMWTNFPRFGPSSFMMNNQLYNGVGNNSLSVSQYRKENANFMSTGPFYSKAHDSFFAVDPFYGRRNETFLPPCFGLGDDDDVIVPYSDGAPDVPSLVENYDKGEPSHTLPFAGFLCDDGDDLVIPYSNMEESGEKHSEGKKNESAKNGAKKSKEGKAKKVASGVFPSNVKSLLATGIFDGVPVKYASWTREKTLLGVIKGSCYLCSCGACELSKAVNAFEFQRHAGGNTKHPNNHIYFENGKTVYALVLELRATPPDSLFEVIQNATGSGVHEPNFAAWKESYQAANREGQLIDGVAKQT